MADQEFLASFAVSIDEAGVTRLQSILKGNRSLAESMSSAFDSASESVAKFRAELSQSLPGLFGGGYGNTTETLGTIGGLNVGLDFTQADSDMEKFVSAAKKPVGLSANASGMVAAGRSAYNNIKSIFDTPITLKVNIQQSTEPPSGVIPPIESDLIPSSTGGRFAKPTNVQVAEDGDAEYIIPIKKENRAIPLLRQLLSELSPSARASLEVGGMPSSNSLAGLSPSANAAIGGEGRSLSGGAAAGTVPSANITQNNQNVSAPISIEVRATSANAEQIGQSIYNTAERYLLRTMKGVLA